MFQKNIKMDFVSLLLKLNAIKIKKNLISLEITKLYGFLNFEFLS